MDIFDMWNDYEDQDFFLNEVKEEVNDESSPASTSCLGFDWENVSSDILNSTDFIPTTVSGSIADDVNESCLLDPNIFTVQAAVFNEEFADDVEIVSKSHIELMKKYELNDSKLSDMTLKSLRRLCKDETDFAHLKSYRRTCLNRCYARSSRNKQHQKTNGLAAQLKTAQTEINALKKELEAKSIEIKYLELENQLLKAASN